MPSSSGLNALKILVIDDDKVTRLTLTKILQKSGYDVIQAENGQQGFSRFCEEKPALILMDVMMPIMDGYAATQAIRSYESGQATPIIILTALEDMESIEHAFNAGATDFITKPINWTLLGQRLKYALKAAKTEEELRASQVHLNYALRLAKLGYWEWDVTKDHINGSASAFELMGVPSQPDMPIETFISMVAPKDMPLLQQAISNAQRGENHIQVSFRVTHPNQSLLHIDCLGDATYDSDGNLIKITGSAQDISRLHKAESIIDYQANHDSLTDLANRVYFNKYLQTLIETKAISQNKGISATIILDIDRFKIINDNLGQNNGDLLLKTLANRLKKVTREDDFVARLGSDEFAIVMKNAQNLAELNLSLNRIFNDLSRPYLLGDQELFITFSFGVAIVHQDGDTANHLLANANVARAQAKALGGNQFSLYQKDMNLQAKSQLLLENDLYKALERNEIEVYFQPQLHAKTLKVYGAEALVRWNHAKLGLISPVKFIPIAESTGLIIEIGQYIIHKAVEEAEKWHRMGYDDLHIGINLSGRQFTNDNLMDVIQNVLSNTKLPAKFLDFEITESLAMSNADHNITVLKGLKALGVSLSIDDFGTGYSSLAYLHSFPVDTIKIDRSFIMNLDNSQGQAIVNTILAMANSLNLAVVAEGIEEEFHVKYLQERNCDIFQGFLFGKPMTATDFTHYLAENAKP